MPDAPVALGCTRCGAERDNATRRLCESCRVAARDRKARSAAIRRSAGICTRCTRPREVGEVCRMCWFGRRAAYATGDPANGPVLARLWLAQGGRCAYTGRAITPGVNASLDHVVPRARGGADTVDNLVWTCAAVNRAKTDMTPAEFRALCAEVLAHDASQNACANDVSEEKSETIPADGPIFIGGYG